MSVSKRKLKDPVSGFLHVLGVVLSVAAVVLLLMKTAATDGSIWRYIGFSVFGAGLILLYSASSIYHLLNLSDKAMLVFRKIDHIMIFVLIAATYTPICLLPLRGPWGWSLLGAIWGFAVLGIVLKAVFFHAPRWLYTACYVAMGWACVVCIVPILRTIPTGGLLWLLDGGIAYSLGAVIYAVKWPGRNAKWFGFHEVFHVLILVGSWCHFMMMYLYL